MLVARNKLHLLLVGSFMILDGCSKHEISVEIVDPTARQHYEGLLRSHNIQFTIDEKGVIHPHVKSLEELEEVDRKHKTWINEHDFGSTQGKSK